MKEVKRSGAGAADVKKFEDEVKRYNFLSWLNQSTKLRETHTNFEAEVSESDDESITTKFSIDNHANDIYADENTNDSEMTSKGTFQLPELPQNVSSESSSSNVSKCKRRKGDSSAEDYTQSLLLKNICKSMEYRNKRVSELSNDSLKTQDEVFGKMIAGELHQLSPRLKIQLKRKISDLVFEFQLKETNGEGLPKTIHSRTEGSFSSSHTTPSPILSRSNYQVLTSPIPSAFNKSPYSVSPSVNIEGTYPQDENSVFPMYQSS